MQPAVLRGERQINKPNYEEMVSLSLTHLILYKDQKGVKSALILDSERGELRGRSHILIVSHDSLVTRYRSSCILPIVDEF